MDWSGVDVCTFRNNLNKLLGTPAAVHARWAVNACCPDAAAGTVFLDIVKEEGGNSYKDAER